MAEDRSRSRLTRTDGVAPDSDGPAHQAWHCAWDDARRRSFTRALALTPAERLRWLEDAIAFAHRAGALPRPRAAG